MKSAMLALVLGLGVGLAPPAFAQDQAELVVGLAAEPQGTLDALVRDDGQRDVFTMNVYETLTRLDGEGKIVPLLATEWSSEGNDWTFKLRPGVKFHDGSDLTADDVAASFNRALNKDLQPDTSYLTGVTSVTAVDPLTVRISSDSFDPAMPLRVKHIIIAPAEWAAPDNRRIESEMMGTGPYKFVAWNRAQDLRIERFDGYWGDKPAIPAVTFRFIPDESVRLAAVEAGEIQIAYGMPGDLAGSAPKVIAGPVSEVMVLRPNTLYGPLMDPDLRRAVNLALDRQTVCDALYGGYCSLTHGQPIIPQVFGYNPAIEDYAYDPAEARRILESKDQLGVTLTMAIPTDRWAKGRELGQVLAAQLEAAGFTTDAAYEEIGKWIIQHRAIVTDPAGAADLGMYGMSNELFDSDFSFAQSFGCGAPTSALCDKDIDAKAAAARAIRDDAEREKAYQAIWAEMREKNAAVPIFALQQVHFVAPNVEWVPSPQIHMFVKDITLTN